MLWLGTVNQCQKYLKTNIFFFEVMKNQHRKGKVERTKKGKVVVVNTWKHRCVGDRVLSTCKTTEYREKGIRCFKN